MNAEILLKHFVAEDAVLRAYVLGATRSTHDADDLLQEIWQVLWRKIDQYDENRPFRPWVFGVARLEVLKWRQRRARRREVLSPETLELLAVTAADYGDELDLRAELLRECVGKMRDLWRRVVTLKYYRELRIRAIAKKIGKSVPAVEMMLTRIRRALRECVDERMKEVSESMIGT